jgi:hypothetical protein
MLSTHQLSQKIMETLEDGRFHAHIYNRGSAILNQLDGHNTLPMVDAYTLGTKFLREIQGLLHVKVCESGLGRTPCKKPRLTEKGQWSPTPKAHREALQRLRENIKCPKNEFERIDAMIERLGTDTSEQCQFDAYRLRNSLVYRIYVKHGLPRHEPQAKPINFLDSARLGIYAEPKYNQLSGYFDPSVRSVKAGLKRLLRNADIDIDMTREDKIAAKKLFMDLHPFETKPEIVLEWMRTVNKFRRTLVARTRLNVQNDSFEYGTMQNEHS